MALRFCAFYFEGPDRYGKGTMEQFLWRVTERLDDPDQLSDDQLSEASEAFSRGLRNSHAVFGEFAFRKWPAGHDSRNPFNRALFETWTVELSRLSEDDAKTIASQLCRLARGAMATDDEYISSITAGTGAPARVALRFARTRKLLTDCRS